jgi:methionyl-tRNA formyltransferase
MLKAALLAFPTRGAWNMHGSLLPSYRGRVPVNWALIHGERETGATLHRMVEKPDAGGIVAQQAVPILPDDTAGEVFNKVTLAAEMALDRVLPDLLAGTGNSAAQTWRRQLFRRDARPRTGASTGTAGPPPRCTT